MLAVGQIRRLRATNAAGHGSWQLMITCRKGVALHAYPLSSDGRHSREPSVADGTAVFALDLATVVESAGRPQPLKDALTLQLEGSVR